jgi:predicted Fe-Mo cluster-binding NifX family protein
MKVAIPTRGSNVDDHFGHCEAYTIFTFDDSNKLEHREVLPSPEGCGCKSNIVTILKQKGVTVMLAGNMGEGAFNILNYHGIKVYRGCSGEISKVVTDYIQGRVFDSQESCSNHQHHGTDDHQCNH